MDFSKILKSHILGDMLELVNDEQQIDSIMFSVVLNEIRNDDVNKVDQFIEWLSIFESEVVLLPNITC